MTTEQSDQSHKIIPKNTAAAFRNLNDQNRKFWAKQSKSTEQLITDPVVYPLALHHMRLEADRLLLGGAAEKLGLSIGYSPPVGESQAPTMMHKWPFMPPNGAISTELCCRESYLTTAQRAEQHSNSQDRFYFRARRLETKVIH